MSKFLSVPAVAVALSLCSAASGQFLMMPDSTNNRVVLFDPNDGSLVNSNYFPLAGGTPVHALQVGNEIWVSEQIGDRVSRWSLTGSPLGAITGALDNIRGMALINNKVYVTNGGTGNGAIIGVSIFDTAGAVSGSFPTAGLSPSPFGILEYQGGMLVASSSAPDDIHRFDLNGASLGTFHNTTSLNFVEQMDYATNGSILAAGFSSNNVARLDPATGALIESIPASGARGVYQLGNGNIMWSSGAGAFVYDVNTQSSSLIYAGGGRYLDYVLIPTPGGVALFGLGGIVAARRRR